MDEFINVEHPQIEGSARQPLRALPYLEKKGWRRVGAAPEPAATTDDPAVTPMPALPPVAPTGDTPTGDPLADPTTEEP